MFKDVGQQIKGIAVVVCVVGIAVSLIIGLFLISTSANNYGQIDYFKVISGLIIMLVGPFFSWINSLFMYGFGELVDKTAKTADNTVSSDTEIKENSTDTAL